MTKPNDETDAGTLTQAMDNLTLAPAQPLRRHNAIHTRTSQNGQQTYWTRTVTPDHTEVASTNPDAVIREESRHWANHTTNQGANRSQGTNTNSR